MRGGHEQEGARGEWPSPGDSLPEEPEDFDDSLLGEVARTEPPSRLPTPGMCMGGRQGRRFELREELGRGAMGRVFRAWDHELQREVALKFLLHWSARAEPPSSAYLREEARAVARLDHENIVRLFDFSEWRGERWEPWTPFLVMEFLEGESLASLLRRERPGLRRTLEIMEAVAAGLAHAHAHRVVHRDLKPSNVLLTREGRVKLLDFGLAHLMSGESQLVPHLPTAGTPAYMAPEQWRGQRQDARTDLWAAGVLLYELLTGALPLPAVSLQELRERVTSAEPMPSVRERVPELPEEVERLVAALLLKEPARRLGSASELRERLRGLGEALGPWREDSKRVSPQRRQVTLVSCGLAVSSHSEQPLDPEDASEWQAAFHRCCADVIRRHEGSITLAVGDEVLACFGYPTAREDDSERAVRAGLELARLCPVEVGVHTDAVVFDVPPLEGLGRMPSLQGEAPRRAAALARQAGPGAVVLGGTTWRLVRGAFETEPLGPGPGVAYRVLRERTAMSRFERVLSSGELSPLVGRARELERLCALWARARRGEGAYVLLSGEAGIGKSRLIQELRARVSPESGHLLLCQCWEPFRDSAFHPIIELLRHVFRLGLEGLGLPPEHERELAALLAPPDTGAPSTVVDALGHQKEPKRKVLESLRLLFLRMAEERPVVLAIEDLHWADPSTLELLELLSEHVAKARLLVILSARPEFQPPWPPRPGFHQLVLERLPAESAEALVRELARGGRLPEETVRALVAKTDGIPLFVEEMTRMVLEREPTGHLAAIPVTLHELLLSRLDALPLQRKALAQLCAVVGRGFSVALISQLLDRDESLLREDFSGLVSAGLLQRAWEDGGGDEYQFHHALIQEAAYQSLPRSLRRQHHRRVAQALVEHFRDVVETRPEVLAHHYTQAGESELAVHQWEHAAKLAALRSATLEACSHLKQGLALLRSLPDGAERTEEELRLLSGLGMLLMETQGYGSSEVEQLYSHALELFHQRGSGLYWFAVLWLPLGSYFIMGARFDAAKELVDQVLALGQQRQSPRLMAYGYRLLASIRLYQGRFDEALEHCTQAVRSAAPGLEPHLALVENIVIDDRVEELLLASIIHLVGARPRESWRFEQELLAILQASVHPVTRSSGLLYLTLLQQMRGDVASTLRRAEETLVAASKMCFQPVAAAATGLQGWALSRLGRTREGLDVLGSGIVLLRKLGVRAFMPYFLQLLAEVDLMSGRVEEGLATVEEALELVEKTGARLNESELYRVQGQLRRAEGKEEGARASLLRAVAVAHRQRAYLFELRARVALACQLRDTGHPELARRRLERLCGRFAPDLDVAELQEARELLEQLRSTPAPPPHPPPESPPGAGR